MAKTIHELTALLVYFFLLLLHPGIYAAAVMTA
jgi:hypothetical protein